MRELKFDHPFIPFRGYVEGGLGVGRKIKIKGKAEFHRDPRFCINFGVAPNFHQSIGLHISPRYHENAIVITHLNNGLWGVEQRYHNRIHDKCHFEFKIKVTHQFYEIKLNGCHLASVPFAIPAHLLNHMEIEGGVKIEHIHIKGHSEYGPAMVTQPMVAQPMVAQPMVMPYAPPPPVVQQQYVRPPVMIQPHYVPNVVVVEPYHHHHHGYHHHHHCD